MFSRYLAVLFLSLSFAYADTLYLRNGSVIKGSYAGGDTTRIKMRLGEDLQTYSVADVTRIEFNDEAAPPPPPTRSNREPLRDRDREPLRDRDNPPPSQFAGEVPAGTRLVVRMIDDVDSERDNTGRRYRASVDEPVMVNGETLIPRDADVIIKLVEDKQSGKLAGKTVLTLDVMQVQVNGRMVDVATEEVSQSSSSRGARTAKTVGGGAVLGAILGGVFGGGKGAAIGAASGGAVGAGAEVLTKGQRVRIPSETRLSFTLEQPIRL